MNHTVLIVTFTTKYSSNNRYFTFEFSFMWVRHFRFVKYEFSNIKILSVHCHLQIITRRLMLND